MTTIRCLLDTNIYGLLAENKKLLFNFEELLKKQNIIVYGADIIRKELRNTPKKIKLEKEKLRLLLLKIYDKSINNKELKTNDSILTLAMEYFKQYKKLGGVQSYHNIKNDFIIVAIASLNNLDIIVTEDNKTMASKRAIKSYVKINILHSLRTPKFLPINSII